MRLMDIRDGEIGQFKLTCHRTVKEPSLSSYPGHLRS
jgi:hypothetical protein